MTRREEIEQQAALTVFPWDDVREQSKFEEGFIEGAKYADKTMIEKACEWVEKHIFDFPWYDNEHDDFSSKDIANALRKAMEE